MKTNWLKKIGNKGIHNAFTDLCEFNEQLFCCFREATNHVSADGAVRILTLDKQGNELRSERLHIPNTDLRDPKLSVTPDGNLMLIAYARGANKNNQTTSAKNLCWISQTGCSWSSFSEFADEYWWLWRIRWHQNQAYGFAYNRKQNAIHLYKGNPKRAFHLHQPYVLSLEKHHKGYPNESDLFFDRDQAYALIRRDADSYSAQLGKSTYPFKKWRWQDLGMYIGGPAMLKIGTDRAIVAGRVIEKNKLVTSILQMQLSTGKLSKLFTLPSSGDNSYPGLVRNNNSLYVSYYSSHQDTKSSVYLAEIDISGVTGE